MKKEWQVTLKAEYTHGSKTFAYEVVETEEEAVKLSESFRRNALGKIGCPNRVVVEHVHVRPGEWNKTLKKTVWELSLLRGWSLAGNALTKKHVNTWV